MRESIYECERGVYRPTRWAGSPWSRSSQHGGPVIGLFAREAERVAKEIEMQVARVTVDLFQAVPLVPLRAETRLVRRGGRIAALEASLYPLDGGAAPVSRASALLLRPTPHPGRHWETEEYPPPPMDTLEGVRRPVAPGRLGFPPGFHDGVEMRAGVDEAGPFVWLTTSLDLVDGEAISPLQRAMALTDMTLGTQMRMAMRRSRDDASARRPALMINTDTTAYWERPFVGEHLGMRASLVAERDGVGTAEAILYDAAGRVGRALQSALLQRADTSG